MDNMKSEMVQMQQNAVQNQTATMLEIGTNLLSQTAEQTRKLTDVETQVGDNICVCEIQYSCWRRSSRASMKAWWLSG